ncbi:hypothetical protein [Thermocrispum sp.]|mgnify:CR=1 FL=1|uniref:hypothetical protein n=1 Tax=Thermocrispum sp. TaxID=2060768 RepID=UPI00257D963F|nr:hypothetical protein [Thermocrispum sp.]
MRPTPTELITQVRRVLRDVIEPELSSGYARARLAEVRAVLAQVDWDNAGLHLMTHTTALRDALGDLRAWAHADEQRRAHFGQIDLPEPDAADFAGWNHWHSHYTGVVTALIDPLEDWLRAHPDDADGAALRHKLLTLSAC